MSVERKYILSNYFIYAVATHQKFNSDNLVYILCVFRGGAKATWPFKKPRESLSSI